MNARQPLYLGPTANPCGDAEAWENAQEARAEAAEQREILARGIVLAAMNAATPESWRKDVDVGHTFTSPDGMLYDALSDDDPDVEKAYAELLTSPQATALHLAVASYQARKHAAAITWSPA